MTHKIPALLGTLFLIAFTGICNAQQGNIWAFGTQAGLDFNTAPPTPVTTNIVAPEACAAVCDDNGQLLFYTNGQRVWDRLNNFMQNGFSICSLDVSSTTQGALIMPMPDSSSRYYIFSLTSIENGTGWGRLYYSVVDMSLNNGLGAVVDGRKEILIDTGLQENMTAVAGKNCNIWLLTVTKQGMLKAFNIDHTGINATPVQSAVTPGSGTLAIPLPGSMCVSPDRKKLAIADVGLTLYDFNAATGTASNPISLSSTASPVYYATAFSPDNSKLYSLQVSGSLDQHDLSSGVPATIVNSRVVIVPAIPALRNMKLGPDGKIYCIQSANFLSVINQPNQSGAACNYVPQAISLPNPTFAYLGLPNVVPKLLPTGDSLFNTTVINVSDCFTNSYELQADTPLGHHFAWDDGSALPQRTVHGPGTYWLTYTRHCDVYTDTFIVHFPNAAPVISTYPGCKGSHNGAAAAHTPNTGYAYTWRNNTLNILSATDSLGPVAGGNYTLRVITPLGCDSTFNIHIPEEEHYASFIADSIICQGTTLSFNNTSDIHFTQFQWSFGDGGDATLQNPAHIYTSAGNYNVRLIARGPVCIDTVAQNITVDSMLQGRFHNIPDSICTGQAIAFFPDTNSTVLGMHWKYGDGLEITDPNAYMIQHAYDADGTLPVELTIRYRACPSFTFTDTVYVYPMPKVYLGPDSGICLDGAPIYLENRMALPDDKLQNLWNTGDTASAIKIVHPGIYSLTVSTGPLGCSTTESVTVNKDCYIDIPNAFTPNGDGANDYFFPRQLLSKKITQFNMQIINRWGELVFETTRVDGRGWDGQLNNRPQPAGVYIYLINAMIDDQRQEHYTGNVTLIR